MHTNTTLKRHSLISCSDGPPALLFDSVVHVSMCAQLAVQLAARVQGSSSDISNSNYGGGTADWSVTHCVSCRLRTGSQSVTES